MKMIPGDMGLELIFSIYKTKQTIHRRKTPPRHVHPILSLFPLPSMLALIKPWLQKEPPLYTTLTLNPKIMWKNTGKRCEERKNKSSKKMVNKNYVLNLWVGHTMVWFTLKIVVKLPMETTNVLGDSIINTIVSSRWRKFPL